MATVWSSHEERRPSAFRSIRLLWRVTSAHPRVGTFGGMEANLALFCLHRPARLHYRDKTYFLRLAAVERWIMNRCESSSGSGRGGDGGRGRRGLLSICTLADSHRWSTLFLKGPHRGCIGLPADTRTPPITLKCLRKWMSGGDECIVLGNTGSPPLSSGPCTSSVKRGRAVLLSFTWGMCARTSLSLSISLSIRYALTPDHLLKSALSWWAAGSRRWKGNGEDSDPFKEATEKDTEILQASAGIRTGCGRFKLVMLQPWGPETGRSHFGPQTECKSGVIHNLQYFNFIFF